MTRGRGRAQLSAFGLVGLLAMTGASACGSSPSDGAPSPSVAASSGSMAATEPATVSTSATPSPSVSMPASLTPAQAKAAASAIEAYRQYTLVLDQVRQNGGDGSELLRTVATQQALAGGMNSAGIYAAKKWRLVGQTRIAEIQVRSVSLEEEAVSHTVPEVVVDSCEDLSDTDVLDALGRSVRPSDLAQRWKSEIWIRYYPDSGGPDGWLVGRHENEGVSSC